tara:strand:- start:2269 stop:2400 length:132 start_codon:yes stop_codon:yes gene_type:complete
MQEVVGSIPIGSTRFEKARHAFCLKTATRIVLFKTIRVAVFAM